MCGLIGIWSSLINHDERLKIAGNMLSALHHRGPDASNILKVTENLILGHVRLAILDLSIDGNQPMISPSGRYTYVFNGEIYNYIELQKYITDDNENIKCDSLIIGRLLDKFGLKKSVSLLYPATFIISKAQPCSSPSRKKSAR
jgi:asparagine synthase (glutamine-hydrolysing)